MTSLYILCHLLKYEISCSLVLTITRYFVLVKCNYIIDLLNIVLLY
nr:MAG TPA: hypothetical protein [Caudoviricetes sp.]